MFSANVGGMKAPKTLQEAVLYFGNPDNCHRYMVALRWPNGVECPACGRKDVRFISTRRMWECKSKHPRKQFSAKVGTIWEDSPIAIDKCLVAAWMLANCKNGVSSYEIASAIGVTQKSAWFMMHRIRKSMHSESTFKLGGPDTEVEVDETFIGGKARNMHLDVKQRRITGTGGKDKTIVFGALERGGNVSTAVVADRKRSALHTCVREHVEAGSALYSDALQSYDGLARDYAHQVIDHAERYVDGLVHTNGLENFWSLLKRSISGTYVSVEPFHLFRYLDEQSFRYNNRKTNKRNVTDADRFNLAMSNIVGKRLTYAEVTGKVCETSF